MTQRSAEFGSGIKYHVTNSQWEVLYTVYGILLEDGLIEKHQLSEKIKIIPFSSNLGRKLLGENKGKKGFFFDEGERETKHFVIVKVDPPEKIGLVLVPPPEIEKKYTTNIRVK
ncbi:MAG: hypothetical protein V4439_01370 [Patescibacteria group bacterium]